MILILTINMLFLTATEQYFAYLILEKILSNLAIQRGLLHNKDILNKQESFIYQSIRLFKRRLLVPNLEKEMFSIKINYENYLYSP